MHRLNDNTFASRRTSLGRLAFGIGPSSKGLLGYAVSADRLNSGLQLSSVPPFLSQAEVLMAGSICHALCRRIIDSKAAVVVIDEAPVQTYYRRDLMTTLVRLGSETHLPPVRANRP